MISNQVLQNTLEGLKEISRTEFCVIDTDGKVLASTFSDFEIQPADIQAFVESQADSQLVKGFQYFKVCDDYQLEYVLVAHGDDEDTYMVGKLAAFQIQNLIVAYKERFDKDSFIKNLLLDNLLLVDIYNRAKKLHIEADVRRVVMILELNQEKDHSSVESVKSLFGGKSRDFITAVDEKSIIIVKELEEGEGYPEMDKLAHTILDTLDLNKDGEDVTNDLSFMCIQASMHVHLPAPSLSVRVWNGSPHEFLIKAAELTRTGIGLPAYYNDEVIIPALQNRGLSLEDAREYNIIGCVEPQKAGKTEGWHDAAFFNMCRPLELVFSNGMDKGEMVGIPTGDVTQMKTFDEFFDAYKKQMEYCISLLVNADNAIDVAHAERCPLPFLSCMIDDCLKEGKSVQEGGAVYNFTGPQGFGIANMADGLFAIRKLVYEDKKVSMKELKEALAWNYDKGLDAQSAGDMTEMIMKAMQKAGRNVDASTAEGLLKTFMGMKPGEQKTQRFKEIHDMIDEVPKFGNDIPEVDYFAREVAYTYSKPLQKYNNPRGGKFQAGLYPVSANVPLGGQTGATPDGRYAHTPVADGVSPSAGKDVKGPTAAATSVSRLDHFIVSNGTLFNQKFHPSALSGREGLEKFVALIRGYFDQKGMHMQFNVVDRQTLLDAQEHPEKYKHLVVRVAGYSALFTTLSRSLQDDIIRRTEQGF